MIKVDKLIDWGHPGKASVLVGGGFGSEGKGQIAGWLAHNNRFKPARPFDWGTCNSGAQAGHTTRWRTNDMDEQKFICYHLPTCSVVWHKFGDAASTYINAGAIIDVEQLMKELDDTQMIDNAKTRLFIHPNATVIAQEDKDAERLMESSTMRVASTMKGVGSALSRKIMRKARVAHQVDELKPYIRLVNLTQELSRGKAVFVEIPQGFGLSLNHGHKYPYTTSRDCWVGSGLSDAGIHPSFLSDICMVVRTKPIRVGPIFNERGEKLGDSGPFYPGSSELSWERDLPGKEPELTTVTKRVRRIATWSDEQYYIACLFNRPTLVALSFVDYLSGYIEFLAMEARMKAVEGLAGLHDVKHIWSVGPYLDDIKTDRDEVVSWLRGRG